MSDADQIEMYRRQAAEQAVGQVESGMVVGLGVGRTAAFAVRRLAELIKEGQLREVIGVPCSRQTERDARQLGIPLASLEEQPVIDLTIDGADEIDPRLNLIKGGGGALLREKIVAQASRREIIIADEEKLSPALGTRWPVPVEVFQFGWRSQRLFLESLGARVLVRQAPDGHPYKTDQDNYILDCYFGPLDRPADLAARLEARAGIAEHGLFLGLASDVIVAGPGGVRHLRADGTAP